MFLNSVCASVGWGWDVQLFNQETSGPFGAARCVCCRVVLGGRKLQPNIRELEKRIIFSCFLGCEELFSDLSSDVPERCVSEQ